MPAPDEDAEQQPAFRVTKSTADLVSQDFGRYQPSLQRMADDWRAAKKRVMQDKKAQNPTAPREEIGESYEPTKACQ